jgi:hypothetical protein
MFPRPDETMAGRLRSELIILGGHRVRCAEQPLADRADRFCLAAPGERPVLPPPLRIRPLNLGNLDFHFL